jgi:hypothetical protein
MILRWFAIFSFVFAFSATAETVIIYQGGGMQSWKPQYSLRIKDNKAQLNQYSALVSPEMVSEDDLIIAEKDVTPQEVEAIIARMTEAGFFDIKALPEQPSPRAADGNYALLRVTQGDTIHEVSADDVVIPALDNSILALQSIFPQHPLPRPNGSCSSHGDLSEAL